MADDQDFTAYALARWTQLVRTLLLLGVPDADAHALAADALSRCHDRWSDREEWADPDVEVFEMLLDLAPEPSAAFAGAPGPALEEAGWDELAPRLRALDPDRRAALALEAGGALTPEQASQVTGGGAPAGDLVGHARQVVHRVPVTPPPMDSMLASSRRRRRRRTWATGVGVATVAAAVAAGALAWAGDDPTSTRGTELSTVRSDPFDNPAPLAWYAGATFYLPEARVYVGDVREFDGLGNGAVYLDLRGGLVTVDEDGTRQRLASLGAEGTFALARDSRMLAWIDSDTWRLVGYDLQAGQQVLDQPVAGRGARVVAVDDGRAYYTTGEESYAVDLADGGESVLGLPGLLDVAGPVRAYQPMPGQVLVEGGRPEDLLVPGATAALDAGGRHLLVSGAGPRPTYSLHDLDTGRSRRLPVGEEPPVAAAAFGPLDSLVIIVNAAGSRTAEIRVCEVTSDACPLRAVFPAGGAPPLIEQ